MFNVLTLLFEPSNSKFNFNFSKSNRKLKFFNISSIFMESSNIEAEALPNFFSIGKSFLTLT